jgi:hypothetical protein
MEDSPDEITFDTLFISSLKMEVFRNQEDKFVATDSVKILRGLVTSLNDITIYSQDSSKIITKKVDDETSQPVIWYAYSQVTGDSISIYLLDNKIHQIDVDVKSFILTQNENYPERFDQYSSSSTKLFFDNNKVSRVEYFDNVFSIY